MSLRLSTSFVQTNIPGAYIKTSVKTTPTGVGNIGNVVIIGEAAGGDSFKEESSLKDNFFTPDQAGRVAQKYISGNIVDAVNMLASPSNDPDIVGSANRIYILKTNKGIKASSPLFISKNQGIDGNKISYKILETQAAVAAEVTSDDLSAVMVSPTVLDGLSFSVRVNGSVVTTVTLSNTTTDHDTVVKLAAEIDAVLSPSVTVSAVDETLKFVAVLPTSQGSTLEFIDSTVGDLAVIGLDAGLTKSASFREIEINVVRTDIGTDETLPVSQQVALEVSYEGTSATLVINDTTLAFTVAGGAGTSMTLNKADYVTVAALAEYINSQTGYTASVTASAIQKTPASLDKGSYTIAGSAGAGLIFSSVSDLSTSVLNSTLVDLVSGIVALPATNSSFTFLTGGAKGGTTAADIMDALTSCEGLNINFIIPLMSRDASEDIVAGATESSSTYTIDAIHASVKNHVLKMSTVKMKRNRIGMLSYKGTYSDAKNKVSSMANYRINMTMQDVTQVNTSGVVTRFQPWMQSVVAAGMQVAGFYRSVVKRFANVISVIDPDGFDSGNPGDVSEALDKGFLFMEEANAGWRWVSDQTTYGYDTNFVYNSLQAVYLSDILAMDLCESLDNAFTGKSLADVDAGVVAAFISAKMDTYKRSKIIASSDDAPLGYKNLNIEIDGPVLYVQVHCKLSTSIYFIPIELELSQVSTSA